MAYTGEIIIRDHDSLRRFLDDSKSLALEYVYKKKALQFLDSNKLLQREYKVLKDQNYYHLKTVSRKVIYKGNETLCHLVCWSHVDDDKIPDVDLIAFNFYFHISAHVVCLKSVCCVCHTKNGKLCARCYRVCYCSVECQRSDWTKHKQYCSPPQREYEKDIESKPVVNLDEKDE